MSRRRTLAQLREISYEELNVELKADNTPFMFDGEEIVPTDSFAFFDTETSETIQIKSILERANKLIDTANECVVFQDDIDSFIVVSLGDLKSYKLSLTSTDFVMNGIICKGPYTILASVWHNLT